MRRSEPERQLGVNHAVILTGKRTVVHESVFGIKLQVLHYHIVKAYFIISLSSAPFGLRTIKVVTGLYIKLLLDYRSHGQGVKAVGLIACGIINIVFLGVAALIVNRGETITSRMNVLRTERPIVYDILAAYGITVRHR